MRHLLDRWQARGSEIRLVAGHFPLCTTELLDVPFTTLTVLRPPVERTLSYLRHQKKLNKADAGKSLEEIYEDPFRYNALIRNHMTRMLSMSRDELIAGDGVLGDVDDTPARLERAKQALAGLDLFGLQPRFEELCAELSRRYGVELGNTDALQRDRSDARIGGARRTHRPRQRARHGALRFASSCTPGASRHARRARAITIDAGWTTVPRGLASATSRSDSSSSGSTDPPRSGEDLRTITQHRSAQSASLAQQHTTHRTGYRTDPEIERPHERFESLMSCRPGE